MSFLTKFLFGNLWANCKKRNIFFFFCITLYKYLEYIFGEFREFGGSLYNEANIEMREREREAGGGGGEREGEREKEKEICVSNQLKKKVK